MPSRRELIRMMPGELDAYLRAGRRIVIVTNGIGGLPHPVPMNYGLDAEGRVLLTSFAKSQKVRNLERDPRATLLVESGAAYAELRSAILYCDVEIVTDTAAVADGMQQINAGGQLAGSLSPAMSDQVRASLAKRVLLRCAVRRTVSWDHAKLGAVY